MMKHDIVVETLSGSISLPDPSDHPAHITVQQMCAKHLRLPIKFVAEHMPEALKMPEGPVEGHSQPIKVQLVLLPARVRDYSIERPPEDVIRIDEGVELRKYLSKSFIYQLTGRGLRETTPCREHWYTRGKQQTSLASSYMYITTKGLSCGKVYLSHRLIGSMSLGIGEWCSAGRVHLHASSHASIVTMTHCAW